MGPLLRSAHPMAESGQRCDLRRPHMTLDAPTEPASTPFNRRRVCTQWSLLLLEIENPIGRVSSLRSR